MKWRAGKTRYRIAHPNCTFRAWLARIKRYGIFCFIDGAHQKRIQKHARVNIVILILYGIITSAAGPKKV